MRRLISALLVLSLVLPAAGEAATPPRTAKRASSVKAPNTAKKQTKKKKGKRRSPRLSRQTQPDPERSREIQEALRREGYLTAPSSGKWDQPTRDAMARYQKDQGFSVTGKPDALSLKKMGLGPKYDNRLQPSTPTPPQTPNH